MITSPLLDPTSRVTPSASDQPDAALEAAIRQLASCPSGREILGVLHQIGEIACRLDAANTAAFLEILNIQMSDPSKGSIIEALQPFANAAKERAENAARRDVQIKVFQRYIDRTELEIANIKDQIAAHKLRLSESSESHQRSGIEARIKDAEVDLAHQERRLARSKDAISKL